MNKTLFEQADYEYVKGNHKKSFKLFLKAAQNGDEAAMDRVASMYDSAQGVEYDFEKAIYWYTRAFEAGCLISLYNLGIAFRNKGNLLEAKLWFERALESGDPDAALELGKLYMICEDMEEKIIFYLNKFLEKDDIPEESRNEALNILSRYQKVSE